jgi:hypothetical protein
VEVAPAVLQLTGHNVAELATVDAQSVPLHTAAKSPTRITLNVCENDDLRLGGIALHLKIRKSRRILVLGGLGCMTLESKIDFAKESTLLNLVYGWQSHHLHNLANFI